MNRLKDKVAIVTGGGAGIGRATCELFAEEGAAVVVAERDTKTGQETAERITRQGGRALFVRTDVADEGGEGEAAGVVVEVELDAEVEVAVVVEAAGVETAS